MASQLLSALRAMGQPSTQLAATVAMHLAAALRAAPSVGRKGVQKCAGGVQGGAGVQGDIDCPERCPA